MFRKALMAAAWSGLHKRGVKVRRASEQRRGVLKTLESDWI